LVNRVNVGVISQRVVEFSPEKQMSSTTATAANANAVLPKKKKLGHNLNKLLPVVDASLNSNSQRNSAAAVLIR
jgi:hypothetical protein